MKTSFVWTCVLLAVLGLWVSPCLGGQDQKALRAEYDALLAKVKKSDDSVDFGHLRKLATQLDSYSAMSGGSLRGEMNAALRREDYKAALKLAEKDLAANYLDIDAHIGAMVACQKLGDAAGETHHRYVGRGILTSILRSGDGKTPETAYQVIAINEEYATLRELGFQVQSQSVNHVGSHDFDIFSVSDPKTKETQQVYFNIDPIWAAEKKMFGK